jgi:hypothetical protein
LCRALSVPRPLAGDGEGKFVLKLSHRHRSSAVGEVLSEDQAAGIAQSHNSEASLGSNLNGTGFPIFSFGKSG